MNEVSKSQELSNYKNKELLTTRELLDYAVKIVSSYVGRQETALADVTGLIFEVYQSLGKINSDPQSFQKTQQEPAVPISQSVKDDYIICLEDGKPLQMLKRHLSTRYGMSLGEYLKKWGLPEDYPTVAPRYARRRSEIAKKTGLGINGRRPLQVVAAA